MTTRKNIKELNDHLQAFPKAEDIFVKEQQWLKNHFLPLMSIDLAEIHVSSSVEENPPRADSVSVG